MNISRFETDKRGKEYQMEYSFDEKSVVSKQTKLEFVLNKSIKDGTVSDYDTLKLKGVTYSVGDYVELYGLGLNQSYVAKLTRIVKVPNSLEKLPFIIVKWCIKKPDLPKSILQDWGCHISSAQVFPSEDFTFCLYIQSIKCKCFVMTEEEYSQMLATYEYYYFSRATYNHEEEALKPCPDEWKKQCVCKMPINPDLVYVQCSQCQKWFHDKCVEIDDLDATYACKNCIKSK